MKEPIEDKLSKTGLFLRIALSVVFLWGLSGFLIYSNLDNWSDRGTFGDLFGAVNALFSGLAFAGLIFTIYMQAEAHEAQKKDIAINRRSIQKSMNIQEQTLLAMSEQAKQTQLTAQLNALNTLINYYNIQIDKPGNDPQIVLKAREKRRSLIKKIDTMIEGLDHSEVD
ncbi:MAG: hypothetical protein C4K58_07750 [Flavobacteriaceae bacterium]|nr:MAG: hypothetical protein C4K58_07750 [Flavobacteriaceae bacterium]